MLRRNGVSATVVRKHSEGAAENGEKTIVGRILDGEIRLVVNTPHDVHRRWVTPGTATRSRTAAILSNIPCITTVQGLGAAVQGIEAMRAGEIGVRSLQDSGPAGRAGRLVRPSGSSSTAS